MQLHFDLRSAAFRLYQLFSAEKVFSFYLFSHAHPIIALHILYYLIVLVVSRYIAMSRGTLLVPCKTSIIVLQLFLVVTRSTTPSTS